MMLSLPAPTTKPDSQQRLLNGSQLHSNDLLAGDHDSIDKSRLEASARSIAKALGNTIDGDPVASAEPSSDLTPLSWLRSFRVAEVDSEEQDVESPTAEKSAIPLCDVSPQKVELSPMKVKSRPPGKPRATRMSTKSPDKPRYSFANLIFMAIENSESKCLPVKSIYDWILHHFPYYKVLDADPKRSCWRNSVRHNLSLNQAFMKMLPVDSSGKKSDKNKAGKVSYGVSERCAVFFLWCSGSILSFTGASVLSDSSLSWNSECSRDCWARTEVAMGTF